MVGLKKKWPYHLNFPSFKRRGQLISPSKISSTWISPSEIWPRDISPKIHVLDPVFVRRFSAKKLFGENFTRRKSTRRTIFFKLIFFKLFFLSKKLVLYNWCGKLYFGKVLLGERFCGETNRRRKSFGEINFGEVSLGEIFCSAKYFTRRNNFRPKNLQKNSPKKIRQKPKNFAKVAILLFDFLWQLSIYESKFLADYLKETTQFFKKIIGRP